MEEKKKTNMEAIANLFAIVFYSLLDCHIKLMGITTRGLGKWE